MAFKEQDHPFYKPLWRRVGIVAVTAVWLAVELYTGSSGIWLLIPAGMLAYAVYVFFITWPKDVEPKEDEPKEKAPKDDAGPMQ